MNRSLPTRALPKNPDPDQLRRQAKDLLKAFRNAEATALAEVTAHFRNPDPATFALHDAQLVLARAYGFESWPKLMACVDGVTVQRLAQAVREGEISRVRAMLRARPELVNFEMAENDEHRAIHYAVFTQSLEMVRFLMQHGADARRGIYPHRQATTARNIAVERGYTEIVEAIDTAEALRRGSETPAPDELSAHIQNGDNEQALAMLEKDPTLAIARDRNGCSPLHHAAATANFALSERLLALGAPVNASGPQDLTPLDCAAHNGVEALPIANLLRVHGADMTPRGAVILNDADWIKARHSAGTLDPGLPLLTTAVQCDRPEILQLLLDLGFDPNEPTRLGDLQEVVYSLGAPLWHCADSNQLAMAKLLLERGANPNVHVYAGGPSVHRAYDRRDTAMIELLQRYGGVLPPVSIGLFRERELARQMLAEEAADRHLPEGILEGRNVSEDLLRGAADSGDPEIVRMALPGVDWPRDSDRWFYILMQAVWSGSAECVSLLLTRCNPNLRHPRFGRTILHDIAGLGINNTNLQSAVLAGLLLDAGASLTARDDLLCSTPLGWACRWGRLEMARLLLERGADPVEPEAELWATPRAWAEKKGHHAILHLLKENASQPIG